MYKALSGLWAFDTEPKFATTKVRSAIPMFSDAQEGGSVEVTASCVKLWR